MALCFCLPVNLKNNILMHRSYYAWWCAFVSAFNINAKMGPEPLFALSATRNALE